VVGPRTPHKDIGFYTLDTIETMEKQAALARQHGVYGFCFYYYWFSGKKLLEKPLDMLLQYPHVDINFCLCWANENWTRAWEGLEKDILIAQDYSDEDRRIFMEDIVPYIQDPRYIRVEGKPVVIVYNPSHIPDLKETMECWRKRARELEIGELLLWHCDTGEQEYKDIFDASIDFPPAKLAPYSDGKTIPDVGSMLNYEAAVMHKRGELLALPKKGAENHYKTVMGCWDNAARRSYGFSVFTEYSLLNFYNWSYDIIAHTRRAFAPEKRFAFVNAWNEWAEGTYLEPDKKYGYANINTLSKAIFGLPLTDTATLNTIVPESAFEGKIAIQIHMYYTDLIDEIMAALGTLPYKFDCFISTDTKKKKKEIEDRITDACVEVYENRGRDVAPFLMQMKDRIQNYDYICHIHTKKSHTLELGTAWREYLYKHLFGCTDNVRGILSLFERYPSLGLIFPKSYPGIIAAFEWGSNKTDTEKLLNRLELDITLPKKPMFPAGNMFWARTSAVRDIFSLGLTRTDYPKENNQLDSTLAHAVERIWVYLARANGYGYLMTENDY
jgi:lipopolysaccharide biosynthesis protein